MTEKSRDGSRERERDVWLYISMTFAERRLFEFANNNVISREIFRREKKLKREDVSAQQYMGGKSPSRPQ